MQNSVNSIIQWMYQYYGDAIFLIMAAFSYIYLYVHGREWRVKLLYPTALVAFCIVNPVLYYFVFKRIIYWRLFWMLPNILVIAVTVTKLVQASDKRVEKGIIIALFAALIVIKGTNVFKNGVFIEIQNWQKVSKETKEVCDLLLAQDGNPKCVMPSALFSEVRQYSGDIEMMYGRDAHGYIIGTGELQKSVNAELDSDAPNYSYVLDTIKQEGYSYLITYSNKPVDELILNEYGFTEVARTGQYISYFCAGAGREDK